MKSYLTHATVAVLALLASCSPTPTGIGHGAAHGLAPKESPAHRQYLALPGQGAINTHATDTHAAFEEQVAAYTGQTAPVQPQYNTPEVPAYPQAVVEDPLAVPANPVTYPTVPTVTQPQYPAVTPQPYPAVTQPAYPGYTQPVINQPAADGSAGYAVQVYNATNGRIFVEMHDDSDNIFPVASMYAGQKISTQPAEPRPITGQITVIIRDPDQPGAPELRRYKVTPPPAYMGKTLGITILSGGRYRASVDGEVYYATPEPTEKPAEAPKAETKPATPAPAPAPAPAATPAA